MGTLIFYPCYSVPSFSTSSQFSNHPKLRTSRFFFKGIADRSREASPRFKVYCKILDVDGNGRGQEETRIRPPTKMSLRNKTPNINESDINALVRQVQSSLRKETDDTKSAEETTAKRTSKGMDAKKTSKETTASPDERNSVSAGILESKSPAAEFWENHLLSWKQEETPAKEKETPAKERNGALTKPLHSNQKILSRTSALDLVLREQKEKQMAGGRKLAQTNKNQITANTKASVRNQITANAKVSVKNQITANTKARIALENQPIVDLRSTRPRSNFVKRSPISKLPIREEIVEKLTSEASLAVAAKTEELEVPILDIMKRSITSPPHINGKEIVEKASSEALVTVAAKTEEQEVPMVDTMKRSPISPPPINGKEVVEKTSSEPLLADAAKTEKREVPMLDIIRRSLMSPLPINGKEIVEKASSEPLLAKSEEQEEAMLDEMKVLDLRLLAKARGLKAYSKLKKKELVEMLRAQV